MQRRKKMKLKFSVCFEDANKTETTLAITREELQADKSQARRNYRANRTMKDHEEQVQANKLGNNRMMDQVWKAGKQESRLHPRSCCDYQVSSAPGWLRGHDLE